jgi:uncharacterized membrane protein HdeD (DUF308 family)
MTTAHKPLRVFCSYSHKDEEYLNELRTWLSGLELQELIEWWHDRKILPSSEWEDDIDRHLRSAEIILLLVTPDFMASEYVQKKEIGRAMERHVSGEARLIPIIVRPADWKWALFGKLQVLPKDATPITTWDNRDVAWLDVVIGIRKVVEELTREPDVGPIPQPVDETEVNGLLRYREGVELAWADGKLDSREVDWLRNLANTIGLSPSTAADLERKVMGDTIEGILAGQVEIPDLSGQVVSQASSTLANRGLELGTQNTIPHDTIPKGKIIRQSPEAGDEAKVGSSVSITVSSGPQSVPPALAENWWTLALRGLVMVVFGLLISFFNEVPDELLLYGATAMVYGALMMTDGILAIIGTPRGVGRRSLLRIESRISGLAGLVTFLVGLASSWLAQIGVAPGNVVFFITAFWAICIGITRMLAAIRLRREFKIEWLKVISGALLVVFGTFLLFKLWDPRWLLGIWPLASGVSLLSFASQARARERIRTVS